MSEYQIVEQAEERLVNCVYCGEKVKFDTYFEHIQTDTCYKTWLRRYLKKELARLAITFDEFIEFYKEDENR